MQLTRLDRWLRERFVYETHVYTLRAPEFVPVGVIVEEMPEAPGRRFRHRMIIRDGKQVEGIISSLKASNQMFTTRVVDREEWYVRFLAPEGKSVTWWVVWFIVGVAGAVSVIRLIFMLWNNPTVRENVTDALRIFKG